MAGVQTKAEAMSDERPRSRKVSGGTTLEHMTGRSRGVVTWLGADAVDIYLDENGVLRAGDAPVDAPPSSLVARLRPTEDTFEIEAAEGCSLWVNGAPVTSRVLNHNDMIEFGETGPISRFRHYPDGRRNHRTVEEIVSDEIAYLRTSRKPPAQRIYRALTALLQRLAGETTLLFRGTVIATLVVLAVFTYQQHRLNVLLEQRIETGIEQLENFSTALARAREEALTPQDLIRLRSEIGRQVTSYAERLAALEERSGATARVIAGSVDSIVFLQGAYGYMETATGRMMRHIVDAQGRPMMSPFGRPLLSLEGDGPVAERQYTGTGFAVGDDGVLVTNRHVAMPWENDGQIEAMAGQGLEPAMIRLILYRPGLPDSADVELVRASEEADLAVLRRVEGGPPIHGLRLAEAPPAAGDEIIVMGYPTGLRAMLAQAGKAFIEELQRSGDFEFWSVARRLAEAGQIAPLASRGIVGQTGGTTIVYDAETTHGGSGGPVLDTNGAVVAVNTAILPEYGGSNFGVPVDRLHALLTDAGVM